MKTTFTAARTDTYITDTAKWIIGLPEDETHEAVGTGFETLGHVERTYDANGRLLVENVCGVEQRFTYTSAGDIETTTDARGKVISYSNYKRGIAQIEQHPEAVEISRVVNDTGTLQSQTNGRGFTTSFQYDNLNRLTAIDYPINADVTIAYQQNGGAYERVLTRANYEQLDVIGDAHDRCKRDGQQRHVSSAPRTQAE